MILLDTNVISEMMKEHPARSVTAWLDGQLAGALYISAITISEIRFGILILPVGRRSDAITAALVQTEQIFRGKVLPFDQSAAAHYAELAAAARTAGKGFPMPDAYIAAIAVSKGFAVATRDSAPFKAGGVKVINPWAAFGD